MSHLTGFISRSEAVAVIAACLRNKDGWIIIMHPEVATTVLECLNEIPEVTYIVDQGAATALMTTGPNTGNVLVAAMTATPVPMTVVCVVPGAVGESRLIGALSRRMDMTGNEGKNLFAVPSHTGEVAYPVLFAEAFDIVEPGFLAAARNAAAASGHRPGCTCGEPASRPPAVHTRHGARTRRTAHRR